MSVEVIGPDRFRTIPCPTYPDIPLSLLPRRRLVAHDRGVRPDALHIATEGPLGLAARRWARRTACASPPPSTPASPNTSRRGLHLPVRPIYAWMRRFHGAGQGTMVATPACATNWSRGASATSGRGRAASTWRCSSRSRARTGACRVRCSSMSAGWRWRRISGRSWTSTCRARRSWSAAARSLPPCSGNIRRCLFTGPRYGEALARAYAGADVFVFPSLTDTFGLVILEALACGTPVAAFPVTGPKDVLADAAGTIGAVNADLRLAALAALDADRAACRAHAERYSWRACAELFLSHLVPLAGQGLRP